MNLLVGFEQFQLPEWLTFGNAVSALISLVGLITAFIKLSSAQKSNKSTFGNLAKLLEDNIKAINGIQTVVNNIDTVATGISKAVDSVIVAISEQQQSNNNLAAFVFECFNLSNLSNENKLKLKVLYDQLFYKTDAAIIDDLKQAKADVDKLLLEKDKYVLELEGKLKNATEKLNTVQSAIRKSRRVSS